MLEDLNYSWRTLRRFKLYALATISSLALGVGATAGVFSVIDATLLRPLPYSDPESLVALNSERTDLSGSAQVFPLSQIELVTWRAGARRVRVEAVETRTVALTGNGEPEVIQVGVITSGFFELLGVRPALGRVFTAAEEREDAGVVVLSHEVWRARFNLSASVLGQTITLAGRPHEIIGAMPQDFRLVFDPSTVWTPFNPVIDPTRQNLRFMSAIGRLNRGVTVAQAQAELAGLSAPLANQFPLTHSRSTPAVQTLSDNLFGPRATALWMLGTAVFGLLLLACANVANLTLNHLAMRQGELATRAVMGASAGRVIRLLLVQMGTIALVGGSVGVAVVATLLPYLMALYNSGVGTPVTLQLDWRVLAIAVIVVSSTTLLCTLLPALKIYRASARGEALRMAAVRFSVGRLERRVQATLVSLQIGLAVALLCASGTLMKSLNSLLDVAPGFTADHVLTMQMMLPPAVYPDVQSRAEVVRRFLENVAQVPGVVAVGTTQATFLPAQSMFTLMHVEGIHLEEADRSSIRHITPGYFDALKVAIVEGRAIDSRDQVGAPAVCMVSQSFARKYFPKGDALGRRVRRAGPSVFWMSIIGVVGDVRDAGLATEPAATLYVPYLQSNTPTARVSLVARTASDPVQMAGSVRQAIWQVDRNQPIDRIASLQSVLVDGTSAERFRTLLVNQFAITGVLLAIVGVYAMTSAAVTARTWEAGLRLALGARPWSVGTAILREAAAQVAAGIAFGLIALLLVRRLLEALVFGTSAADPASIVLSVGSISLLALSAAAWQARRLTLVSPALGLRGPDAGTRS